MSEFEEEIDKIVEMSLFYDFYGELLKDHQRKIFEDYVLNDLSLGEIAKEQGISRQGVYDLVKRCGKQLSEYEQKLGLVKKFKKIEKLVHHIKDTADEIQAADRADGADEIRKTADKILEEL